MAENISDVKEDIFQIVSPGALSQKCLNEDDFMKASRETIEGVVFELVDKTAINISEGAKPNSASSSPNKGKLITSQDSPKTDNTKDLPVRRSSRIQSKAVKKEEPSKKKQNSKSEGSIKMTKVTLNEEMTKSKEILLEAESVNSETDNVEAFKSEDIGIKQKESCTRVQQTTPKRSTRRTDKREDSNANDLKPEKKTSNSGDKQRSEKRDDSKTNNKHKSEKKESSNDKRKLEKKEDSIKSDMYRSDKIENSNASDKLKSEKKEDSEAKIRSERKKNTSSRKRKQDSIDAISPSKSSNEDDKVSAESIQYKNIIKDNGIAVTKVVRTPLIKTQENANVESKVDSFNCCSKTEEDKSSESGDASESGNLKPVKVKSRWLRSSELEGVLQTETASSSVTESVANEQSNSIEPVIVPSDAEAEDKKDVRVLDNSSEIVSEMDVSNDDVKPLAEPVEEKPSYEHIDENIYRFEKKKTKIKKQARRMVCDCTLSEEERVRGVLGCKEECLNRLLMIECGNRCPLQNLCSNKRFQNKECIKAEVFKSEGKGWGLRPLEHISAGDFLMEFVGEVLNHKEYRQRAKQYARDKNIHCYFMVLKTDEILDATIKGNYARFINHSCDPNCETQKWTVGGELRVGVFARRSVSIGEEFTLDYKFQTYG